ncbi:cobaltochelatase subunit CobN [Carboxylicivirga linearis]|uniref:Cobaltochelatase subunit CobN n=1 Tax=Carboxylicivirga linearis TaxID=1628157 RepID=A0ABS5JV02_9BACT|nr:cobaltochelatase subunit CobN [Carboxylicivirga linearis]MBS2098678.1 cobaltochelatase subunit CobN [Carboxylicivirga linearis]
MKTKKLIGSLVGIVIIVAAFSVWGRYYSPTKVALINYPEFMSSKMAGANENSFVKIDILEQKDLSDLKKYDMLLFFGMGLKLTEEQLEYVHQTANEGVAMNLWGATTKGLNITNITGDTARVVESYLDNGGNKNYRNLFNYIRTVIDGKTTFTQLIDTALTIPSNALFYIDEEVALENVKDFESYCVKQGVHKPGYKKIALLTSIPGPFNSNRGYLNSLIHELEERQYNVYPVAGFSGRLKYMKEISPDLIIYIPHGRLSMGGGNAGGITQWLQNQNVPVLCPIMVHQRYEDWLDDKKGMQGGLLSQSVTMPEFDGGIAPYALFAEFEDEKGHLIFKAIPNRLKKFGEMVDKYTYLADAANVDKKVAIVYFKGPGKNALVAADMEVLPSLHNVLLRMQKEGYNLGDLPADYSSFEKRVMKEGPVLGPYADGAFDTYLQTGNPALITADQYEQWCEETLPSEIYQDVVDRYGKAPGNYMSVYQNGKDHIAVGRVQFGNVAIVPQQLPGLGNNTFALVHGAKVAPPHTYIAPYLWIQKAFEADAIMHFGTHGSLEFTPGKQIALSDYDWTDPLIGNTPHGYVYTISNIGEAMIAKRRSYAATLEHLTPPFIEAKALSNSQLLVQKMDTWSQSKGAIRQEYALSAKKMFVDEGMHLDLNLNDDLSIPYTEDEMHKIEAYLAELQHEKVAGGLYTLGIPYTPKLLDETVLMMHIDALAFAMSEYDFERGAVDRKQLNDEVYFRKTYLKPSTQYVQSVIKGHDEDAVRKKIVATADYKKAMDFKAERARLKKETDAKKMAMMKAKKEKAATHKHSTNGKHDSAKEQKVKKAIKKPEDVDASSGATPKVPEADPKEQSFANAVLAIENTLYDINKKKKQLAQSPEGEMVSILNFLDGGYIRPNSGGDPIANSSAVPTGFNVYSINAENTPTKEAWKVAKKLTDQLLEDYKKKHDGVYPQKISFTLWAGSFIESEGTTIAQILYMMGIEPIWTPRGKVNDIRLISEEELGRPRIDLVVQTSGQLRDLAASRLFIINRAVAMAADAQDGDNLISKGMKDAEKYLIDKGYSPKEAREMSKHRVFGGVNGNYGTAIMGMVEKSDSWDSTSVVAKTYLNNMGAVYGTEDNWGDFGKNVFEAALLNTEAVVQPRQSNAWGALSLDHVYEFMGGINLAVKEVTGNDAESYFNDFRNSNKPRVMGLKETIGIESKTTLLNPRYIQEHMKGGASSAEVFAETFRNTFGWNVMKESVIEDRLWDDLYEVYVEDKYKLQVQDFFRNKNPYALQEMTAIMLETVRKGMWEATPEQVQKMAAMHANLVTNYEAGCSGFVCDNAKLRLFINNQLPEDKQQAYNREIDKVLEPVSKESNDNVVLKKEEDQKVQPQKAELKKLSANTTIVIAVLALLVLLALFIRLRRK